jgi:hypothetical protein
MSHGSGNDPMFGASQDAGDQEHLQLKEQLKRAKALRTELRDVRLRRLASLVVCRRQLIAWPMLCWSPEPGPCE